MNEALPPARSRAAVGWPALPEHTNVTTADGIDLTFSQAGRSIYERMGYRTIANHTLFMEKRFLEGH